MAVPANYESNLLELQGLSRHDSDHSVYVFSALGLVTFGFIYGLSDIWVSADTCITPTWAAADPCGGV